MTFVGKVFTVLILVLSLVFMAFSVFAYVAPKNWRDVVMRTPEQAALEPGKEVGLLPQLKQAKEKIKDLQDELAAKEQKLRFEQIQRREVVSKLETEKQLAIAERDALKVKVVEAQKQSVDALARWKEANATLATQTGELNGLRAEIRDIQSINMNLDSSVRLLTDTNHDLKMKFAGLNERSLQLSGQLIKARRVLNWLGVNENTSIEEAVPVVNGFVTERLASGPIEITIGSDDGLRPGHQLDVFRGKNFISRVRVTEIRPDVAVCEELRNYRKDLIKRGDRVTTKL
jgi:hypothetical protein